MFVSRLSSCRFHAASTLARSTGSMRSGVNEPITASSSTPAAWITADSGCAESTEPSADRSSARSAASAASTRTSAPAAVSSATSSAAPGASGPRRESSVRCCTPWCATTWRATEAPAMPVPPVISTVPRVHAVRHRHHDLADVAGLAEVPQRRRCPPDVPRGHRKWTQNALVEHPRQFDDVLVHPGAAGFEEVERAVANAGMRGGNGVGIADVGLAHLQERATTRHQSQRGVDEVTRQRVEHDVEAAAAGDVGELLLEVQRARVADVVVVEAHGPQRVPLRAAGGGVDVQAPVPGELHRGESDAAGRGVDEDRLTGLDVGQFAQAVVRRGEHDERRGRLGVGPARRDGCDESGVGLNDRAGALGEQAHHAVADGEVRDALADLDHHARALAAEQRVVGEHAEGDHHVAEVGRDGVHLDADVGGAQRFFGVRDLFECEVVERARGGDAEAPRLARGRRLQHGVDAAAAHDAGDVGHAGPHARPAVPRRPARPQRPARRSRRRARCGRGSRSARPGRDPTPRHPPDR